MEKLDAFTQRYLETALWSSNDESTPQGGEPLNKNYGIEDISPETLQEMKTDCAEFQKRFWDLISVDPGRAGRDFWLTRNRHGAGFWDGDWDQEDGEVLTVRSHEYGGYDLYVGDDGKIHGC